MRHGSRWYEYDSDRNHYRELSVDELDIALAAEMRELEKCPNWPFYVCVGMSLLFWIIVGVIAII